MSVLADRLSSAPFFPTPLPNEHLYGALARYHVLSGNRDPRETRSDLAIASGPLRAQDAITHSARSAPNRVAALLGVSGCDLVCQHTLWPLFCLAMPAATIDAWQQAWENGTDIEVEPDAKLNRQLLRHDRSWRCCLACIDEDRRRYGVAYWHVEHQIPGLSSCPHHGRVLSGQCQRCGQARLSLDDLKLPAPICRCDPKPQVDVMLWDDWLYALFLRARSSCDLSLERVLQVVRQVFDLPQRIGLKQRRAVDEALTRIEAKMGISHLARLFVSYDSADGRFRGGRRPNLVSTTLRDPGLRIRHPLYYLVLLWGAGISVDTLMGQSSP